MGKHIPRDFIELLLQRADLVSLIDTKVPLKKTSSSNYFACCPFHQERTPSFCVNQVKQFYYCFGCGVHGNALDFIMQYERVEFPVAVEVLANYLNLPLPSVDQQQANSVANPAKLHHIMAQIVNLYAQQLSQSPIAQQYINERAITPAIVAKFHLGYAPGHDVLLPAYAKDAKLMQALSLTGLLATKHGKYYARFRDRLMFPITNRHGQFIGFGGRVIGEGQPKYLNSPESVIFHKGKELYGLAQALQYERNLSSVLVVEGYTDVLSLVQHGITAVVATLGTAISAYQIKLLLTYTQEIVFCFDGDQAGHKAALRAFAVIWPLAPEQGQIKFMFLPDGEDPDSLVRRYGAATFKAQVAQALTLSQYFFRIIAEGLDLSTVDGRTLYLKAADQYLRLLPAGLFKQALVAKLEQQTGVTLSTQMPQGYGRQQGSRPMPVVPRVSALRYALTLMIQYPCLAKDLAPLPASDTPGVALFNRILASIQSKPNITTGTLLELWRDQAESKWMAKLASQSLLVNEQQLPAEFAGAMQQVRKQLLQDNIQGLLQKSAVLGLSPQEKQELLTLINTDKQYNERN